MNDLQENHEDLMERWSNTKLHKNEGFVIDGPIDPKRWQSVDRKIVLLLKEAYGEDTNWSLPQLIRDEWRGPKYKIWWTASYWLYALNRTTQTIIPDFPSTQEKWNECTELLLSAAVVNIKKSRGKSVSDDEELLSYARTDKQFLREQMSLLAPDIILCGNTFKFLKEFWVNVKPIDSEKFFYRSDNTIIINYWHPANHYPNQLCFYSLCALFQKTKIFINI